MNVNKTVVWITLNGHGKIVSYGIWRAGAA
jgi:uncharacterized protein YuzE